MRNSKVFYLYNYSKIYNKYIIVYFIIMLKQTD